MSDRSIAVRESDAPAAAAQAIIPLPKRDRRDGPGARLKEKTTKDERNLHPNRPCYWSHRLGLAKFSKDFLNRKMWRGSLSCGARGAFELAVADSRRNGSTPTSPFPRAARLLESPLSVLPPIVRAQGRRHTLGPLLSGGSREQNKSPSDLCTTPAPSNRDAHYSGYSD